MNCMKTMFGFVALCVLLLSAASPVQAEWIRNGVPVCTETGDQSDPTIAPDGTGGVVIVWDDTRSGTNDIYAQRMDANGAELWTSGGVVVCSAAGSQDNPRIMFDGAGGWIIMWTDNRGSSTDIYAQKINSSGVAQWMADGIAICTAASWQVDPRSTSDGSGGAIIAWTDDRSGLRDIYAQRIDALGDTLWPADGVPICMANDWQQEPAIATDGVGGAIIAWQDNRSQITWDIYAQRIDSVGVVQWTVDGILICTAGQHNLSPNIVSDDSCGVFIVWHNTTIGVWAQRVDSLGAIYWTADGEYVGAGAYPEVVRDGSNGIIITFQKWVSSTFDVLAQRMNSTGDTLWTADGVGISSAAGNQEYPKIVEDGSGGAIITWRDDRSGDYDVYGQRVDVNGSMLWAIDGVAICSAAGDQQNPYLASIGGGNAVFTWADARGANSDIYAGIWVGCLVSPDTIDFGTVQAGQYADSSFTIYNIGLESITGTVAESCDHYSIVSGGGPFSLDYGDSIEVIVRFEPDLGGTFPCVVQTGMDNPCSNVVCTGIGDADPHNVTILDVPNDEGGYVSVAWDASSLDSSPFQTITHYSIWRSIPLGQALMMQASGLPLVDLSDIRADFTGPAYRMITTETNTYYWEWIANMDAHYWEHYLYTAATLYDSTGADPGYHYFIVSAHTSDPFVFWDSEPDSGYSVDNLAPCPPLGLAGELSEAPEGLNLTWNPNTEIDLDGYKIYRGTSEDFVPGPGNLLASHCDTFYLDEGFLWCHHYKVSAIDVHDNESGFSLLRPEDVTGVEVPQLPEATYLAQNYPNPFNPSTTIAFGLAEPAHVSLNIYDVSGRLVRVLINEQRKADRYKAIWDGRSNAGGIVASGVYFYRLKAGAFTEWKKMVMMK